MARLGRMPSLLIGGFAASASHLTLAYLAASGAQAAAADASVSVESFASGFAGAALIAYMSSLVSPAFAATQYALLSSLYALPGKFVGGLSGVMVDAFGYVRFFIATATIGIPVVALTLIVWRLATRKTPQSAASVASPAPIPPIDLNPQRASPPQATEKPYTRRANSMCRATFSW